MTTPENPSLPSHLFDTFKEILESLLNSTQSLIAENAMDVLLGILTLFVGWMFAAVFRGVFSKCARAIGVDVIADRSGLRRFMRKNDIHQPPSRYLGWLIYALLLYATTLVAFERMGLHTVADFLRQTASYIPKTGVVLILVALGVGIGKLAQILTTRAAKVSGLPMPGVLGGLCRGAVVLFALFLALNYLEWASPQVLFSGLALVTGVALGLSILFTIAARGLTESLLIHPFLKATYSKGDFIQCSSVEGTVVKIDAAATHIRTEKTLTIIPNRLLAAETVQITRAGENPAGKI
jgi:small-conductance mechanosensitive channel